ncbi:Retrovirus-related Pol polyprotein from transposon TNT 1-94 [Senna tora]|uniref:Retrovirus-related Pol polyprotein from transposon TNT 1-94 n=1 Tax=Senna tora TaxID=362788 RepID=A0A834T5Z4_9FABA|nr:Retrovirus-related Pol polyprotein from transposon TNT 1-94 [Senna tora]
MTSGRRIKEEEVKISIFKIEEEILDCRLRGRQNFNTQANIAENQHSGENSKTLFLATNNFSVNENVWYLNTGCSNHMCGKNELFSSLDESFNSSAKFGNNANIPILGKCQISIRLKDGTQILFMMFSSLSFFALGLHYNLLSMGQLSEKGYDMRVHQGFCTLFDKNDRFVAKVKMTPNRLFPLMIQHEVVDSSLEAQATLPIPDVLLEAGQSRFAPSLGSHPSYYSPMLGVPPLAYHPTSIY